MTTNNERQPDRLDRLIEAFVTAAKCNLAASAAPIIDELRGYGATYPALRKLCADRLDWTPLVFECFMQDVEDENSKREEILDELAHEWGAKQ